MEWSPIAKSKVEIEPYFLLERMGRTACRLFLEFPLSGLPRTMAKIIYLKRIIAVSVTTQRATVVTMGEITNLCGLLLAGWISEK